MLNAKTGIKLIRIKNFLKSDIGRNGGIIIDSNWINVYQIKNVYYNATGIYFTGINVHCDPIKDRVEINEFNKVYTEMKRQDEDFRNYLIENNY